jgi:hypothetical protein
MRSLRFTGDDGEVERLVARVTALESTVAELESQLQEARRHHLRIAEITDVVQELLIPLADRDNERIASAIDAFARTL